MAIYCTRSARVNNIQQGQLAGIRLSGGRASLIRVGSTRSGLGNYRALAYRISSREFLAVSGTAGTSMDRISLGSAQRQNLNPFTFTTAQWGTSSYYSLASIDGPRSDRNADVIYAMGEQAAGQYTLHELSQSAAGVWTHREVRDFGTARMWLCAGQSGQLWGLRQVGRNVIIYHINTSNGLRTQIHSMIGGPTGANITGACFEDGRLYVSFNVGSISAIYRATTGLTAMSRVGAVSGVFQMYGMTSTDTPPAPQLDAPTNLRGVVADNFIHVGWDQVVDANLYELGYRTDGQIGYTTNTYTVTGTTLRLAYNTRYILRLRARVGTAWTPYVSIVRTTGTRRPAGPANLQATPSANSLAVSWDPVTGATGYTISWRVPNGPLAQRYLAGNASTSTTLANLQYSTTYEVDVVAIAPGGLSERTEGRFTTLGFLGAPSNVTGAVNGSNITVSWTAGVGAAFYQIRFRVGDTGSYGNAFNAGSGNSHILRIGRLGVRVYIQVRSVATGGRVSGWASLVPYVTTAARPALPAAPVMNAPTYTASTRDVNLSWGVAARAVSYNLRFRRQPRGSYTGLNFLTQTSLSRHFPAGGTFEFQVQGRNAAGVGPWSNTVTQVVPDPTPTPPPLTPPPNILQTAVKAPNTPTGLSQTVTDNDVALSWTFSAVDSTHDEADFYSLTYLRTDQTEGPNPRITGIETNAYTLENLAYMSSYSVQLRAHNVGGVSAPASITVLISEAPPDVANFYINMEVEGQFYNVWNRVLRGLARWGRTEVGYLSRCRTVNMQLTLENADGFLDGDKLRPRSEVHIGYTRAGVNHTIVAGWVESARPSVDNATGLRTLNLHAEGALSQLANADHELSLFISETVRTNDVIKASLDQAGWPLNRRNIEHGQVRIHPAHYTELLGSRLLHRALPVLQGAEEAEVGFIHEGRGDQVVFEHRFHRELDTRRAQATFGTGGVPVEGPVDAKGTWDNVWTVVTVAMQSARVQVPGRVLRLRGDGLVSNPIVVRAGEAIDFIASLEDEQNRDNENVATVIQWSPPETSHFTATRVDNQAAVVPTFTAGTTGLRLLLGDASRTGRRVTIVNNTANDIQFTKFELHGRGVFRYGNLTLPEETNNVDLYGRRHLDFSVNLTGDGINEGGDAVKEGKNYARLLLARYSTPRITARLEYNPLRNLDAFLNLQMSDPILVVDVDGVPAPQTYYIEGGEFIFDSRQRYPKAAYYVSERGRRTVNRDADLTYTSHRTGDRWTSITPSFNAAAGSRVVAAVDVMYANGTNPANNEDPVLRLVMSDTENVVAEWSEQDIPIGEADTLAALVEIPEGGAANIWFQGKTGPARRLPNSQVVTGPDLVASHYQIVTVNY